MSGTNCCDQKSCDQEARDQEARDKVRQEKRQKLIDMTNEINRTNFTEEAVRSCDMSQFSQLGPPCKFLFEGLAYKDARGHLVVVSWKVGNIGQDILKADMYTGTCNEVISPKEDMIEFAKSFENIGSPEQNATGHMEKYIN